ncbi:MAG: porphobilinogen synthase [Candidatus Methylacidiphilales bacterium]
MKLPRRPRRNRASSAIRALVQETQLRASDLVQPLFLIDSPSLRQPIDSLPGTDRLGFDPLCHVCERLLKDGIQGAALFPVVDAALKTPDGGVALNPDHFFLRSLRQLKQKFPELVLFIDVALDPYTSHGHDGLLDADGQVANDPTVEMLCQLACLIAETGVEYVAPSDMMDGRIGAIRSALDDAGHSSTGIMAYSAKFASSGYGPFRDAVQSSSSSGYLDKRTYQLNPANPREALLELLLDVDEAADIVMVKPAGWYGDILIKAREHLRIPLAAYQVSGEYAMIHAAAQRGWIDLSAARLESLLCLKRAGADLIFSYFAHQWMEISKA